MNHQEAISTGAAERYILGEMTPEERDRFEEHYFACRDCADDMRAVSIMVDGIRAEAKPKVQPIRRPALRVPNWSMAAVAAVLACVVCYQSLVIIPGLRNSSGEARQVAVYLLRPETRSSLRTLQRQPGQPMIVSLDIPLAPQQRSLQALIQDQQGRTVRNATVTLAENESRTFVQLPASLEPAPYTIILRSDSGEAGRYQFKLE